MGKVRKPRTSKPKKGPVEVEPDIDEELQPDSKETALQTILDQLQALNVEEKYCGLQTLGHMIESPDNVAQILQRGIVKSVAPLLVDSASVVRLATAGTLRNLSATGLETCDALMEQDIMTPLTFYFHEHAESWVPDGNSKTKDDDMETFIHCINLLWNLCESSELAIKYLGQSRILDILPRYLDMATFGNDIVTSVLQCLFVVVEDNLQAMEKVKINCEKPLQQLLSLEEDDPSVLLIRTLSAGVIINTCGGNITSLPIDVINRIIAILSSTLSVDHRSVCNQLSSSVPLKDASGKVEAPKGKAALELEKQLKSVSQMLDAQQSSVEIIANIFSCEDADDSVEDNASDSDGMDDEEMCSNGNGTDSSVLPEDKMLPEILEAMISLQIFDKVWARTQLPADNVLLILKEYHDSQTIIKKLTNLQARALLCINNMLSSLPIDNLGGVDGVYKIWVDAGKLVFKQSSGDVALEESATAVMRAALDKIKERHGSTSGASLFNDLSLTDIEMMLTGIKECQEPEIRSNLIRMIGILALLLMTNLNETSSNVICVISEFLLEQAHKENEVWVLAEAIDTIVDLYSEDESDLLAAKVKLVDKLAVLAPILKNKARQQKRLPKEYKVLVSTAVSNLPRFISYKKSRVSKL